MTTSPTIPPDDGTPSAASPASMSLGNVDRLLQHLDAGSLAAQLVEAHRSKSDAPDKDMRAILKARLQQAKEALEHPKA